MTNFEFLKNKTEYKLFASAAIEAEKVYATSSAMCAVGCRKALELAIKWVYAADNTILMPYRDNLRSLIYEDTFRYAVDYKIWRKLEAVAAAGNLAVHTDKTIDNSKAVALLKILFEFVSWIDYCYGTDYEERRFDEGLIPKAVIDIDIEKIKKQESLLNEKESEIEKLKKQIEAMSEQLTASKQENQDTRDFSPDDLSEYKTRKLFIDLDLQEMGWIFDKEQIREEYEVNGMMGISGQKGFIDYVLFGKDGKPLAVIEAKKCSKDPNVGKQQAVLYADCLEREYGVRPMMFTTNGFETYFWDDQVGPQRQVSGVFSRDDLQKLMNRRNEHKNLIEIPIDDKITDRYYQKEAIRAVCEHVEQGFRKNLLVMATGTGKTRTASSLTDVLSRGGYVTNILFLADRTALVQQAKDDFKNYLPDMSLCNLCSNKDDKNARIVFSTYPTMLNMIDQAKTKDGFPVFTPAHFDLIIVDESHRSIFKKYKVIFEYFDAIMVGLTATPRNSVDASTYEFFEVEQNVPTYAYDYETAVEKDHVLVPYYNYEVTTKFLDDGITYDDLSEDDKKRYEEDFAEDDNIPSFIPSSKLNKFVFNQKTVDMVIQDLMERGIKIEGGDVLGKSIIFAQNKKHAQYICERIDALYPKYKGKFAKRVVCEDSYAQTIISEFKNNESGLQIAVSVDMMDTGIDVPECVNLVFFKKVRSKIKFWQMIGRGTRLAPNLSCVDTKDGEYTGKKRFLIFDYCGNFEFFREHINGYEGNQAKSLSENIFGKKIRIISGLQDAAFGEDSFQNFRCELISSCHTQVKALNDQLTAVRLQRGYVVRFRDINVYNPLNEGDKGDIIKYVAPLVQMDEKDEYAKRFDNFMYGLILAQIEGLSSIRKAETDLRNISVQLQGKVAVPQVKAKLPLIKKIDTDEFWKDRDIILFEKVREELRDLIRFIIEHKPGKKPIITNLEDPILNVSEGEQLGPAYDFEDYKKKVNRYVEEHGDTIAIYKLKHNKPLTTSDYSELERVFTQELGSKADYEREYGETPFGLLVRKIAKLDHEAAMEAFSQFINDESLNQRQIAFVNKVITYVENNGYMDSVADLRKPPFDKPIPFMRMFDPGKRKKLVDAINGIKDNAMNVIA